MNYTKNIIWGLFVGLGTGSLLASCTSGDITPNGFDDSRIEVVGERFCSLSNPLGLAGATLQMRTEPVSGELQVLLSAAAGEAVDLKVSVDEGVLEAYNAANSTDFEAVPASAVDVEAGGALLVGPQTTQSDPLRIGVKPDVAMIEGEVYAVPLRLSSETEGVGVSESDGTYIFWCQVLGERPSTQKDTGFITFCYVEVNGNNPLNALTWKCKKSGKPLIDVVNLFSANIKWIEAEKQVGLVLNPNVQHILDNRDKYIKPLQDAGIRVCLTVLGDHDGVGVANLSDEAACRFAQDLRSVVETYGLDGVDFDDEYSEYEKHGLRPGCVPYGADPYARLLYEVKRAMPHKLVTVYQIGQCMWGFPNAVDGVRPGDFIDYTYSDYEKLNVPSFLGMEKKRIGVASVDMTYNEFVTGNLKYNRENGYGVQMIYNLIAGNSQYKCLDAVARYIYDDEAEWTGERYEKEW